jgi:hypothetical protein
MLVARLVERWASLIDTHANSYAYLVAYAPVQSAIPETHQLQQVSYDLIELVDTRANIGCKTRDEALDLISTAIAVVMETIVAGEVLCGGKMGYQCPAQLGPRLSVLRKPRYEFAALASFLQLRETLWVTLDACEESGCTNSGMMLGAARASTYTIGQMLFAQVANI